MPTKINGKVTYQGGEAVPQVGSEAYRQASAGIIPSPETPTMTSDNLGTATPIALPKVNPVTPAPPVVAAPQGSTLDANGKATAPAPVEPNAPQAPEPSFMQSVFDKLKGFGSELEKKAAETQKVQKQQQLAQKTERATSDYNAYVAAQKATQDEIDGIYNKPGVTRQQADAEAREIRRIRNSDLANLAIQANASQGLLSAAEKTIKDKIDAQFAPITEQIDFYTKLSSVASNDLSESERIKVGEIAQEKKEKRDQVYSASKTIHDVLLQNGAPQSAYTQIDQINRDFADGKITSAEAENRLYSAGSPYGVDKEKSLRQSKLQAEIDALTAKNKGTSIDVSKVSDEGKALLSSVRNLRFKSNEEGERIIGNITRAVATGDIEGAISELKDFGYQKLDTSQRGDYDLNEETLSSFKSALYQISDQALEGSAYKALKENAKPFLLIQKDKNFADLKSTIELGQAKLRKGIYGTAVTGSEAANARNFLVTESDNMPTIKWKLNNASSFLTFANDAMIARTTGLPKPDLDSYLTYRVVDKSTGKTGIVPRNEYDESKYTMLNK